MSTRDEQKRENRLKIINAYIELLGGKDIRQVTVADICRQADVARKTLYSHFASKEAILDEVSQRVMFTGAIRAFDPGRRPEASMAERLDDTFGRLSLPFSAYQGKKIEAFVQLMQNLTMHLSTYSGLYREYHRAAHRYFDDCLTREDTRKDFNAAFVADLAVNASVGIILSWVNDRDYPAGQRMEGLKRHIGSLILLSA